MILKGLPWKQTEIILSFLNIAFWIPVDYEGYSISSKRFYTDIYTVVDMSHLN